MHYPVHQLAFARCPAARHTSGSGGERSHVVLLCDQFSMPGLAAPRLPLAALLGLCLGALLKGAAGHGMLSDPASRNVIANSDYCPQCLSAGGAPGGGVGGGGERAHT